MHVHAGSIYTHTKHVVYVTAGDPIAYPYVINEARASKCLFYTVYVSCVVLI